MSSVRRGYLFAGLVVIALALAGCGGNDDDLPADTDAATPTDESGEHEDGEVHWGYDGDAGASNWASLSEEFATCEVGEEQSPIDVDPAQAAASDIVDPVLDWQISDLEIINNGHTIQVNVPEGSTSELNGRSYDLLQFHWHRPSEHTVDGEPFAMELHFVHADATGNLAVLGVLLEEGSGNPLYDRLWEQAPDEGSSNDLTGVDFSVLLPDDLTTYVYPGSLTTPPCSEGVDWYVLVSPAGISIEAVEWFPYDGNARPVQPVNDRTVELDQS